MVNCIQPGAGCASVKYLPERGPGRAHRRASGVGPRRSVLPLPDQVDARPRPGHASPRNNPASTPGHASSPTAHSRPSPTCPLPVGSHAEWYWKMSIDLTRALVPSMGQHDPLDGYISNLQLRATAATLPQPATGPDLEDETRQYAAMLKRGDWPPPIRLASAAC